MNIHEKIETNFSYELKEENLKFNGTTYPKVFRQYVNQGVYVESSQRSKSSSKQSIEMLSRSGGGDHGLQNRYVKVKLCSCLTNPSQCSCHPKTSTNLHEDINHDGGDYVRERNRSEAYLKTICVDEAFNKSEDDINSSIPTTSTVILREVDVSEDSKEEAFRRWCTKKMYAEKLQRKREMLRNELEEREKAKENKKQLERERENFRRWLTKKKHEEEIRKKEKQKKLDEERIKNVYKEERRAENKLHYNLWLKMKEQLCLGEFCSKTEKM